MRRAGDILRVFLDRSTADQAERYHKLFTGWQHVVGERIAAHSEIKDVHNGTVIVEVDHPGWIQMIQIKEAQIVSMLRGRYPELAIHGLRLQLPWKQSSAKGREIPVARQADRPESDEPATETTEQPADPLIRSALDRLGKAIEQRRGSE